MPVVNQAKQPAGEITLPEGAFDGPVRKHLLYEIVNMQRANRRAGTHSTKTRAFVSGGGKKPWRQKGTGRARAGSSRSPIWVGGATVFGPQPRDYSYRLPASARRSALRSALAMKVREGHVVVLDRIEIEAGKTKHVAALLETLGLTSALIITEGENVNLERGARNLYRVKVLRVEGANVYDILRYQHLVLTPEAVSALGGRVTA
ncbi:MAG: 50S ribosomal protein L4 [Candidatus Binatia bacterium]